MRKPFMSGNDLSASMMETLLYQTFEKPYLIELLIHSTVDWHKP